jgi:hypothetical protein
VNTACLLQETVQKEEIRFRGVSSGLMAGYCGLAMCRPATQQDPAHRTSHLFVV